MCLCIFLYVFFDGSFSVAFLLITLESALQVQCLTCMVTTAAPKPSSLEILCNTCFFLFLQPTACRYKMTGLFLQITPYMCRFLLQRKGQQKHAGARHHIKAHLLPYKVALPVGPFTALHSQTN